MRRSLLLVLAVAVFAVPAVMHAQVPLFLHIVPVAVKAKGVGGTDWKSDLFITNVSDVTAQVSAHFFKEKVANTFDGTNFAKSGVTIEPGETLLVTDVVGSWFPSAGSSTKGWLFIVETSLPQCEDDSDAASQIEVPELTMPPGLIVTSRVYNAADPAATYGQIVPSDLLALNPTTHPSIITGIRHQGKSAKPGMRTNLGVVNMSTKTIYVRVSVFRADGTLAGESDQFVPALSLMQWDMESTLKIPLLDANGGRAEVKLIGESALDPCQLQEADIPFCEDPCDPETCPDVYVWSDLPLMIAYASNVDNNTGDGEHLLPVTDLLDYATYAAEYVEANCPDTEEVQMLRRLKERLGLEVSQLPTFRKLSGK